MDYERSSAESQVRASAHDLKADSLMKDEGGESDVEAGGRS